MNECVPCDVHRGACELLGVAYLHCDGIEAESSAALRSPACAFPLRRGGACG